MAYKILEPRDMIIFLNELAASEKDERKKDYLTQCSIFINVVLHMLEE